jgi:sugar phosphate permease
MEFFCRFPVPRFPVRLQAWRDRGRKNVLNLPDFAEGNLRKSGVLVNTKSRWGYRHVVLVVLWLIYIINYFDRITVLTFLPFIREDLGLTHQEVGFAASIFFFAYALAQVSAGWLADKYGPKKVMAIAVVVFTGVTALTGLVRTYTQFILLRLGLGIGEGHHFSPANRAIANWFPKAEKGRATGFFATSWALAPATIPIIVTSIAAAFNNDWRLCFFLLALPGLVAAWMLYYYVADHPEEMLKKGRLSREEYDHIKAGLVEENTAGVTEAMTIKDILPDPHLWFYSIQLFMTQAVFWGTSVWITSFLYEQHGLSLKAMGFMASVPYIVAIFSTLLGGYLVDKIFKRIKPVALISYLCAIPVLIGMAYIPKGNITLLVITLICIGFFVNIIWGVIYAHAQIRYPKEVVGSVVGIGNGMGYMGAFISPLISGFLVMQTDAGTDFSYVFYMLAGCCAIAAMAVGVLNEAVYVPAKKKDLGSASS